MSRQSEKFRFEQSRKFLLTAGRLKDGTNRDEPRGTGQAGLVEESLRREDDAAGGQVAAADEGAGRRRGGAWAAWTSVQQIPAGFVGPIKREPFRQIAHRVPRAYRCRFAMLLLRFRAM